MAALLPYALIDVASVKESLGIASSVTTYDNLITRKINQATEIIERYCQRRFKLTTYTDEEYDAPNTDTLVLKQRPITNVAGFQTRDSSLNEGTWDSVDSDQFFSDNDAGILELNFGATGHWNRYRVTYTAGYETIPADIAEACATLAAYLVSNSDGSTANVKSKVEGQRRIEYRDTAAAGSVGLIKSLGLDVTLDAYMTYPVGI